MKTHEVIATIDHWLKNYDAKKTSTITEPESITSIREYVDALRAMEMEKDIEFERFPFRNMKISETKQYLNKVRNSYIDPTLNVDSYIAKHFRMFNREDTTDMLPDTETLSMLLVEAKQEVGDDINALITALNQDEWLKTNIQTHEEIRHLRKVGLFTVARTQEWLEFLATKVWINAIESGLLNPERIAIFEKMANDDPIIIDFFTEGMTLLGRFNLLTDNNFDTLLTALKGSAQQRQVILTIFKKIMSIVTDHNKRDEQNPVTFNQKDFDILYQLNPTTLGVVSRGIEKMDFDEVLTATLFNDLLTYSPAWQTPAISAHFARLPNYLITTELLTHLIAASRRHANDPAATTAAAIGHIINRALGVEEGVHEYNYNPAQSTHTASVHRSVSESAKKLFQHYDIKTEVVLKDIQAWVEKQPADHSFKGYSLVLASIESKEPKEFLKTKAAEFLKDKQKTVLLQKVEEEGEIFAYWYAEDGYLMQKPLLDMDDTLKAKLNFPKAAEKPLEITTANQDGKQLFGDISAFCGFVPPEFRNAAAQKAIARLTGGDRIDFTDPGSKITTAHLLALAWMAIHDGKEGGRKGELKDAESRLLEGLYEIQRGYNFDKEGREKNGGTDEDKFICAAGTFNKVMEKLNGLHPDVEVLVITWDGLSTKLPKVIEEKAVAYLEKNPDAIEAVRTDLPGILRTKLG